MTKKEPVLNSNIQRSVLLNIYSSVVSGMKPTHSWTQMWIWKNKQNTVKCKIDFFTLKLCFWGWTLTADALGKVRSSGTLRDMSQLRKTKWPEWVDHLLLFLLVLNYGSIKAAIFIWEPAHNALYLTLKSCRGVCLRLDWRIIHPATHRRGDGTCQSQLHADWALLPRLLITDKMASTLCLSISSRP